MELAFAALHQLCAPMLDRLKELPGPQRDALATVFGLGAGPAPNRLLVGLALLSLLSEVAEERPLVCVVDDAQWLDRASAQAMAFAARRLLAESVVVLFAARTPGDELRGLPELEVRGLRDRDARALLGRRYEFRWTNGCATGSSRDAWESVGVTGVAAGVDAGGAGGWVRTPGRAGVSGRLEESFRRRRAGFPSDTQRLMLVAAAEPIGDPVFVWQAAQRLGIGIREAADTDGLLRSADGYVSSPVGTSAVYRAASPEDRQACIARWGCDRSARSIPIAALGIVPEPAAGADEDVAAELERSAGARRRAEDSPQRRRFLSVPRH